jgi:hypothetical protein
MTVPIPTVSRLRRPKMSWTMTVAATPMRAGTVVPGRARKLPRQAGHGEDADWRRRIQPPMTAIPYLAISVSNFHQLFPAKPSSANSL